MAIDSTTADFCSFDSPNAFKLKVAIRIFNKSAGAREASLRFVADTILVELTSDAELNLVVPDVEGN